MIKLQINDKKYKIPESFDEMTLEQYCRIFWKLDISFDVDDEEEKIKKVIEAESRIISRLLGEDDDFCLDLPITVYNKIVNKTRFLYDSDFFLKNAKAGIIIDGRRYSIPPMNEMSLRQYIDADVVMKEKENDHQYLELLSILLTSKDKEGKWEKYNGDYQELMGKLKNMSCTDTLPLVYHFFKKGEALKAISKASMKAVENQRLQHTASS